MIDLSTMETLELRDLLSQVKQELRKRGHKRIIDWDAILKEVQEGVDRKTLAEKYGVARRSISTVMNSRKRRNNQKFPSIPVANNKRAEIVDLIKSGLTTREVMNRLSVSHSQVHTAVALARDAGETIIVKRPQKQKTISARAITVQNLLREGLSVREIAQRLGVKTQTVRDLIKRWNLQVD